MSFIVSDNTNSSTQEAWGYTYNIPTWGYTYNIPMMTQEYRNIVLSQLSHSINDLINDYSGPQIALDDFKQMFKYSTAVNFCNDIEFYRTFYKDDMEFENNLWNIIYEYLYDNYPTVRDISLKDIDAIINDCMDIFNDYYLNGTYYRDNDYIMYLIRSWHL